MAAPTIQGMKRFIVLILDVLDLMFNVPAFAVKDTTQETTKSFRKMIGTVRREPPAAGVAKWQTHPPSPRLRKDMRRFWYDDSRQANNFIGRSGEMADAQDLKIHFGPFQAVTPHHLPHAQNH